MNRTTLLCGLTLLLLQACSPAEIPPPAPALNRQAEVVTKVLRERGVLHQEDTDPQQKKQKPVKNPTQKAAGLQDNNCAYSYFLWGNQAEYDGRYDEALNAYTKALVCAPQTSYIQRKIPGLLFSLQRYDETGAWLKNVLAENPDDPFFLQFLAGIHLQQKKIEEGLAIYTRLQQLQPDDENIVSRLAIIYLQQGKYGQATSLLQKFLQRHPKAYTPRITLARIYNQYKKYRPAATLLEKAQQLRWTEEIANELAYSYRQLGELNKAEDIYRKMITDGLQYEEAAYMLIKLFIDEERYPEALHELELLRPKSRDINRIDYSRSQVLLKQNKRQEAKKLLRTLIKTNSHNDACYLLAILAYQDRKPEECMRYLQQIEKDSERFQPAVFLQARIYEEQKAYGKAIALLTEALPEESRTPFFYAAMASLYQSQKKSDKAITILHQGLSNHPESTRLLYNLGLLHEHKGQHDLAITTMEKLIIKQPDHAEALNFLGYSWANNNINLKQAYTYIQKANTLKPDNAFILDSLGWVLYRMGKLDEANEILEKALLLLPENYLILEHLGDVNFALQRYEIAQKYYSNAYKHTQNPAEQQRLEKKLEDFDQIGSR